MKKERITLCVFYDPRGELKDYEKVYLEGLLQISTRVIVIANGRINIDAQTYLQEKNIDLLQRENHGLDFAAWKTAIMSVGWKEVSSYKNLLITNFTSYGPIFPLEELITTMKGRVCDFWGINRHPKQENVLIIPGDTDSFVREHIQSYFINFKQNILLSLTFQNFWNNLIPAASYQEEVGKHESRLTGILEEAGFISDCYMNPQKYFPSQANASLYQADIQLLEDRNPLVKRKLFSLSPLYWSDGYRTGRQPKVVFDYLKKNYKNFDTVLKDITQTVKMSDLHTILGQTYLIDKDKSAFETDMSSVAFIYFVFYEDLIEQTLTNLKKLPLNANLFFLSAEDKLLNAYSDAVGRLGFINVKTKLIKARGRDVSALLVGARELFNQFEFICFLHDKKTSQAGFLTGTEYAYHNFTCTIASESYVKNVLQVFSENPEVGILEPPSFGIGNEMGRNLKGVKSLRNIYRVNCPLDDSPVAPFGTMFWLRSSAFLPVIERVNLTYRDFPSEPIETDGTILHAFERFYPTMAQDSGFLTGWIAPKEYYAYFSSKYLYQFRLTQDALNSRFGLNLIGYQLSLLIDSSSGCLKKNINKQTKYKRVIKHVGRRLLCVKRRFFPNLKLPRTKKLLKAILLNE